VDEHFGPLKYVQAPDTSVELDWADLATLDLSLWDKPNGKHILADQLEKAIQEVGFFYITNFGLDQEQVDRQFALGKAFFELPLEEKEKYLADLEHGGYNGYKPKGLYSVKDEIKDNIEIYNIPKFTEKYHRDQPQLIKEHIKEIEQFSKHVKFNIVDRLLVLIAIVLELPEDYFTQRHRYDEPADDHLRYMKYHARTREENEKLGQLWIRGHTDFGSLTLLFRQPVAALQVQNGNGDWKWVKAQPGTITVNVADALQYLTGGYLKSSIHRVRAPPADQASLDRLGLLYFVRPEDNLPLIPVKSEKLKRLGIEIREETADGKVILAGDWVKARVAHGFKSRTTNGMNSSAKEEEILEGVKTKYYD